MQSLSTSPSRAQKDDSDGKKEKKAMAVNAVLGVFFFFFPPFCYRWELADPKPLL